MQLSERAEELVAEAVAIKGSAPKVIQRCERCGEATVHSLQSNGRGRRRRLVCLPCQRDAKRDPEVREREYAALRERRKDPEYRERENAALRERKKTPEGRRAKRQAEHRRRARKAEAPLGWVPLDVKEILFDILDFKCAACCAPTPLDEMTVEHIAALGPEGPDCMCNLTLLCGSCNSSKGDTPLREWVPGLPWWPHDHPPFAGLGLHPGCWACGYVAL